MRENPYPARFYGRQIDEPFLTDVFATLPGENGDSSTLPFPQPLPRVLLLLMTLYVCCAFFLIFAVTSYAAPLGSATISSPVAASCVESATIAAH
jgi:hypothetical protein